jgi:HAD superfamily hydrolase (TIGR01509 family)
VSGLTQGGPAQGGLTQGERASGRLAAVLFDLDGTLINSEPLWELALRELAVSFGGTLSDEARTRMVGTSTPQSMAILHEDLDQQWRDIDASGALLEARMAQLLAHGAPWRPGARELLAEVRAAGVPTALVTATKRVLVDELLRTVGRENFDVLVCGDDVVRAKPDPLPYLTAAALLGVDPHETVAIEDSPTGTASAAGAGCTVLAVPSEVPVSTVAGYVIMESLAGVDLSMLRQLAATRPAQV